MQPKELMIKIVTMRNQRKYLRQKEFGPMILKINKATAALPGAKRKIAHG
jgi:hypothetical protein